MLALVALAATAVAASDEVKPLQAPPVYVTGQYALTFKIPKGATYCPLSADWVGSDHGTILFLRPPATCGGAGYPSSSRGFTPPTVPRIEVYYGYDVIPDEDRTPEPSCKPVSKGRLFERSVQICQDTSWKPGPGLIALTASGKYMADVAAETSITLITSPSRASRDMATFRAMLRTVHPCQSALTSVDTSGQSTGTTKVGNGPPCPTTGRWF